MAVETKFICDRCKYSQPQGHARDTDERIMFDVAITCEGHGQYRSQFYTKMKYQQVLWCEKCVDEMEIIRPLIRPENENQPKTIDDMIREIVQQTLENIQE